jgi:molybdate transport system ATP-binding protein
MNELELELEIDVELARTDFRLAVRENCRLDGITAVFGASGSGKTSLLRVIAGLEPAARGHVRFRGTDWQAAGKSVPPERRAVGFVFQDGHLFPHLDVRGNLLFPLRHGRRQGRIGLDETVAACDLADLLPRRSDSLSGGERQRVAIARALLAAPELMLMDEPLSSLDLARKRELLPLIRSLPERFGLPVLYVTHDLDELTALADDVVVLSAGRNVARGGVRELLARSDFAGLTELAEAGTVLEATITAQTDGLTVAALGTNRLRIPRVPGETGRVVRLRVHPRDVILATSEPSGISIRNCLAAIVTGLEACGDGQVAVRLSVGEQLLIARVTQDAVDALGISEGRAIFALIKTVALDPLAALG